MIKLINILIIFSFSMLGYSQISVKIRNIEFDCLIVREPRVEDHCTGPQFEFICIIKNEGNETLQLRVDDLEGRYKYMYKNQNYEETLFFRFYRDTLIVVKKGEEYQVDCECEPAFFFLYKENKKSYINEMKDILPKSELLFTYKKGNSVRQELTVSLPDTVSFVTVKTPYDGNYYRNLYSISRRKYLKSSGK